MKDLKVEPLQIEVFRGETLAKFPSRLWLLYLLGNGLFFINNGY